MNKEKLEKDWDERGFSFGIGTIKSGDAVDESVHDDKDELVVMETGKYEFIIDHKSFSQDGDVEVLIPAGTVHTIKNVGPNDSKIYYGYKAKK
ncbi:MAG: cupin domain-containing protein [Desulfotalea sp.]|nr:MAG: cupin domain-containing protein [Desulfotalea sp.]